MFPVAQHAEALEFLALNIEELLCVLAAALADDVRGQILLLVAEFKFHVVFDGQTVAVPAGNVAGLPAHEVAGLDDHVLEDLVQRRAEMNVAVGVGRAVVQHEFAARAGSVLHALEHIVFFPELQHLRFLLNQIRLHGETGDGQIQRFLIFSHEAFPPGAERAMVFLAGHKYRDRPESSQKKVCFPASGPNVKPNFPARRPPA